MRLEVLGDWLRDVHERNGTPCDDYVPLYSRRS